MPATTSPRDARDVPTDIRTLAGQLFAEVCTGNGPVFDPLDEATPLDRVLNVLQGLDAADADSALAQFGAGPLDVLTSGAALQASLCAERMRSLFELLDCCTASGTLPPSRQVLSRTAQQLLALLAEHQRWLQLADNARYYRDHPDMAARVARFTACP